MVTAMPIPIPPPVETPSVGTPVVVAVAEDVMKAVNAWVGDGSLGVRDTNGVMMALMTVPDMAVAWVVTVETTIREVEVPFITVTDSSGDGPPDTILNCPDSTTNAVLLRKVLSKRIL
jgi:hypothetical protein